MGALLCGRSHRAVDRTPRSHWGAQRSPIRAQLIPYRARALVAGAGALHVRDPQDCLGLGSESVPQVCGLSWERPPPGDHGTVTPVPSLKPLGLPAAERCFGPRALAPGEHVWKSDTLPLGAPRPVLCDRLGDDKRLRGAQRGGRGRGWEAVPRWGLSRGARGSPQRALTRALARGPRGPIRPGTLRSSPGGPVEKDCRPESAASGRESEGRLGTSTPQEPVAEEEPGHRQPTGAQPDPNEPRGSPSLLFTLLPFDGVQSRRKQGSCWGQNHAALRGPRPQGVLTPPPRRPPLRE